MGTQTKHEALFESLIADGHNVWLWRDDPSGLRAYAEAVRLNREAEARS